MSLLYQWNNIDENPPTSLIIADYLKIPHRNWRIDLLVTWMALQAYRAYSVIYKGFKSGWIHDVATMRQLTEKAAAICMLVLNDISVAENCLCFDTDKVEIKKSGDVWMLVIQYPGFNIAIDDFPCKADAQRGLQIMQHYKMDSRCMVGRMTYYLADGKAPENHKMYALGVEPHISFNFKNVQVKRFDGPPERWSVIEGNQEIADFGSDSEAAFRAVYFIKKYEFNHFCWVGKQTQPSMQYFVKGTLLDPNIQGPVNIIGPVTIHRGLLPYKTTIPV